MKLRQLIPYDDFSYKIGEKSYRIEHEDFISKLADKPVARPVRIEGKILDITAYEIDGKYYIPDLGPVKEGNR